MSEKTYLHRGADANIEITVNEKGSDPVTPYDLTGVLGIIVLLYQEGGKVLAKYSKNTLTGYKTLTVDADPATGKITFTLEAADTKEALIKPIYAEIKISTSAAGLDGNDFDLIDSGIYIADVKDSRSRNLPTA